MRVRMAQPKPFEMAVWPTSRPLVMERVIRSPAITRPRVAPRIAGLKSSSSNRQDQVFFAWWAEHWVLLVMGRVPFQMYGSPSILQRSIRPYDLETEVRQRRAIIRAFAQWPVELPLRFPDKKVVDARDAPTLLAVPIELPVLVAVRSEPVSEWSCHSQAKRTTIRLPCQAHSSLIKR